MFLLLFFSAFFVLFLMFLESFALGAKRELSKQIVCYCEVSAMNSSLSVGCLVASLSRQFPAPFDISCRSSLVSLSKANVHV